jgi:aminoglycoside phosphotransferase (APT) family kinase protein
LVWKRITRNLRYNVSVRRSRELNLQKLESYLRTVSGSFNSQFIIDDNRNIKVSNIIRLGGGLINDIFSFSLTDTKRGLTKRFILKNYRQNIDPVFSSYIRDSDLRKCVREWEALKTLESMGLPAPKPYVCECDSRFLGYPFVIMSELQKSKKIENDQFCRFASSLAQLHNLEVDRMRLTVLKSPRDGYAFARRWPLHFKHALNIESKHRPEFRRDLNFALSWLESNASKNYCDRYSLIHGDAHPGNAFLTHHSQTALLDWESVEIGDPAFDVGNAYQMVKFFSNPKDPDSAEQIAERFLSKYVQESKVDIRPRLKFYQVIGILGYAIPSSSCLSSPIMTYKNKKRKILESIPFLELPIVLFAFPFIHWSFIAQKMQTEWNMYLLRYFQKFLKTLS